MLLPAAVSSISSNGDFMTLLDISATGGRLRGPDLPAVGKSLLLRVDAVEAFGTVTWIRGDSCGVEFDCPLTGLELSTLNQENVKARVLKLTPEKKRAYDAWQSSLSR
jgi:hypothetical protein